MKGIGPMNPNANTPRYLGAALLGVVLTSLVGIFAPSAATGSGSISTEGEVCK
jgi:hypothetical protein